MKEIFTFLYISVIAFNFASAQQNKGFQFTESSTGMNSPVWESGYSELEFADINEDGFIDILTIGDHISPGGSNNPHGITVYFGSGNGTWDAESNGDFGYGGIAIGDVNNDGHCDVGYGMHHNYSSTDFGDQLMEVVLGDGTGLNWVPWDDGLASSGESWGMFGTDFADIDNDGDLDIGSNSFGSTDQTHVYLNQGNGTWSHSYSITSGNSYMRLVFGDINNDGNADFVVANDAGIAFFGDGTGNFIRSDFNLPDYSSPVSGPDLTDVDNDGGQDVVYVNPSGGVMVWAFNPDISEWTNLSGTLPATGEYQEVQFRDFNRDNVPDIAAFGNGVLTVWSGSVAGDKTISWTQEFNLVTNSNGDCSAFRVGGDVDRNGFPDMVLVEKKGSWPNDKIYLQCFKETTPFLKSDLAAVFPGGNEVFKQGSAQFTDWISAVPITAQGLVTIDLSLQGMNGPWSNLTTTAPNSGRYQWTIPQTISSNNCFIRYTLIDGNDTLVTYTQQAFTIVGSGGLLADFVADSTEVYPGSEVHFSDQSLGLISQWEWDFDNDGVVDATDRNPVYIYPAPGVYTVKLVIYDAFASQTILKAGYITVRTPVSVEEAIVPARHWEVFPNPCSDVLNIRINGTGLPVTIEINGPNGTPVYSLMNKQKVMMPEDFSFDISTLPAGVYFVRIQTGDYSETKKVVLTGD
ncbi:MAG: FG-GAP-like repeat-containing protein [Lentimicrobium sp.]